MRPIMLFLFAAFALISCEDIQNNSPALQAELNEVLYKSTDVRAEVRENGTLIIQGITDLESLTITLSESSPGVYTITGEGSNRAVYQDFFGSIYTTRPFGNGEVVIQNNDNNTFTGTFKFNAYRFGLDTLNVQKGFFHKVPIVAGSTNPEPDPVDILIANIDGSEFNALSVTTIENEGIISITGTTENQTINLMFPVSIENGNNPIGGEISASYTLDSTTYEAVSGNISVVNHNTSSNEIAGAFSFSVEGPEGIIQISQGQFNVTY